MNDLIVSFNYLFQLRITRRVNFPIEETFQFFFRLKAEKRLKDQQRKQKVTENRKHLANVRVVQKNLVFVVGLPLRLADADVSKFVVTNFIIN